jgi:hypothetical protein
VRNAEAIEPKAPQPARRRPKGGASTHPPIDDLSRDGTIPSALPDVLAGLEPAMVSVKFTMAYTSESLFTVKNNLRLGIYEAVKSGRRTLIRFDSIKRHMASLPAATYAPPKRRKREGGR